MKHQVICNLLLLLLGLIVSLSHQFEFGKLYHYSYDSVVDSRSYGDLMFKRLAVNGHIDACCLWTDGTDEVLRIEFHTSHKHAKSSQHTTAGFAVVNLQGNRVNSIWLTAPFPNVTISEILVGFAKLLVPRKSIVTRSNNMEIIDIFDSSFGQHHPISIFAHQVVSYSLLNMPNGNDRPISFETVVQSQLIATSECGHVTIEGENVKSVVDVVAQRSGSVLKEYLFTTFHSKAKYTSVGDISKSDDGDEYVDLVSSSPSFTVHKDFFQSKWMSSVNHLRRYFSNVCLQHRNIGSFVIPVALANYKAVEKNQAACMEINYGISCLLNQVCYAGQSGECQRLSSQVFDHLHASFNNCENSVPCQLATIRAFESVVPNLPLSHSFLLSLALRPNQHSQITAGAFRALAQYPDVMLEDSQFKALIRIWQSSETSAEIRFSVTDFLLKPLKAILHDTSFSEDFAFSSLQILKTETDGELTGYLHSLLPTLAFHNIEFRRSLLQTKQGLNLWMFLIGKEASKHTSFASNGYIFEGISFNLNIQNSLPDVIAHSSFSVNQGDWRLFEVEIDAIGIETLMGSIGSSTPSESDKSNAKDPAASVTFKVSSEPSQGSVVLRHADLFRGQDEIMSALWNAPSEPTPVSSLNSKVLQYDQHVVLINGLRIESEIAMDVKLDVTGSISISLWSQTAETLISTKIEAGVQSRVIVPALQRMFESKAEGSAHLSFHSHISLGSSGTPNTCLFLSRDMSEFSLEFSSSDRRLQAPLKKITYAPVSFAFNFFNSQMCQAQLG